MPDVGGALAALVALPVMAQAQSPSPGVYIGAEGGINWLLNFNANTNIPAMPVVGVTPGTGWMAGGVIGYDFVGPRVELEGIYRWIGFLPSRVNPRMPVPNQFVGLFEQGTMKIRGIELRRSDAPVLVKRAQAEMLRCLSNARTLAELRDHLPEAVKAIRTYRRHLHDGHATVEELAITKSLSQAPQTYRHRTLSMIAAQELLARGVSLQAGDSIQYIITDTEAAYPPDRVRAVAGLDGTWSYDCAAYDALLCKAALAVLSPLGVTLADLGEC